MWRKVSEVCEWYVCCAWVEWLIVTGSSNWNLLEMKACVSTCEWRGLERGEGKKIERKIGDVMCIFPRETIGSSRTIEWMDTNNEKHQFWTLQNLVFLLSKKPTRTTAGTWQYLSRNGKVLRQVCVYVSWVVARSGEGCLMRHVMWYWPEAWWVGVFILLCLLIWNDSLDDPEGSFVFAACLPCKDVFQAWQRVFVGTWHIEGDGLSQVLLGNQAGCEATLFHHSAC